MTALIKLIKQWWAMFCMLFTWPPDQFFISLAWLSNICIKQFHCITTKHGWFFRTLPINCETKWRSLTGQVYSVKLACTVIFSALRLQLYCVASFSLPRTFVSSLKVCADGHTFVFCLHGISYSKENEYDPPLRRNVGYVVNHFVKCWSFLNVILRASCSHLSVCIMFCQMKVSCTTAGNLKWLSLILCTTWNMYIACLNPKSTL